MNISSGSGSELIQIADAVAKEKLIDPKLVIDAMEESLAKAAKSKYCLLYTSPSPRDFG